MPEDETAKVHHGNVTLAMEAVHNKTKPPTSRSRIHSSRCWSRLIILVLLVGFLPGSSLSFVPTARKAFSLSSKLYSSNGSSDDIERELQRARAVLEKSKAKLAASKQEVATTTTTIATEPIPFFACAGKRTVSRDGVVKSKDEKTGLITTDGERMAAISEEEDWEARSLDEVFESEITEDQDVYSLASQQLADRDVAASIWGLRQQLHTDDYQRIFDKRNRFIGEVE